MRAEPSGAAGTGGQKSLLKIQSGMIEMGMGEDHCVNLRRSDWEGIPVAEPQVPRSLEQPAIEQHPPPKPFQSDGCSLWFDTWEGTSLYPACFFHDLKYWAGFPGEEVERLIADAELMIDVARLLSATSMAEIMFHGVRVGGTDLFKTPFCWGFGRVS